MTSHEHQGMAVHTLGTGGGPIVSSARAGTSTVVTVDGHAYVIDCGMDSIRNYRTRHAWSDLRAVFLTHLHSDHVYDLGAFLVTGWEVPGESFAQPIRVMGPGPLDRCPSDNPNAQTKPVLGTRDVVSGYIDRVYAPDIAIRREDEGRSDPWNWLDVQDIEIPAEAGADPMTNRHPQMEAFVIYQDEHVKVTAILVDHRLCFPAFGFRFDSAYGSVVISGDTTRSANLIQLAQGADLLVHEVIDLEAILDTFPDGPTRSGIEVHLRESHTSFDDVGKIAREAGVNHLVLNHVVPNTPGAADIEKIRRVAATDFGGPVDVAEDGDVFTLTGTNHQDPAASGAQSSPLQEARA